MYLCTEPSTPVHRYGTIPLQILEYGQPWLGQNFPVDLEGDTLVFNRELLGGKTRSREIWSLLYNCKGKKQRQSQIA